MFSRLAPVLAVLTLLAASACGPTSFSCNIPATFQCTSITLSSGSITNATCSGATVDACATTGIVGRCTFTATITEGSLTATKTTVAYFYTGADATAAQTGCTAAGGTWSN